VSGGRRARGSVHHLHEEAVLDIADRISAHREQLARQLVQRFRAVAAAEPEFVLDDTVQRQQYTLTLESIDAFVGSLRGAEPLSDAWATRIRETAARRVNQRVSLEYFLRAARVWGEVLWDAVVAHARIDRPREREAAIEIASRLMRQVDLLSRVAMDAYLDEITDRGLLRRDLLDALLSGHGDSEGIQRQARDLHLKLAESYIVVVVRGAEMHGELGQDEPLPSRAALDRIVETTRSRVRPHAGSLLAGMRHGDLVVLYPVTGPDELEAVRHDCAELAKALTVDVSIGMSVYHTGLPGLATAYAEARDAAATASRLAIRGRAVGLDDVLIDHMLQESTHAQRLLEATLQPLTDYDRDHGAQLLATLQAYVRTHFNLTRSAEILNVHANTVVYRLRRIRELSGRDPYDVEDLVVLSLALKARDLRASASLVP
jgi:sugar diacid utilization regulator